MLHHSRTAQQGAGIFEGDSEASVFANLTNKQSGSRSCPSILGVIGGGDMVHFSLADHIIPGTLGQKKLRSNGKTSANSRHVLGVCYMTQTRHTTGGASCMTWPASISGHCHMQGIDSDRCLGLREVGVPLGRVAGTGL